MSEQPTYEQLESGLDLIRQSPASDGKLELIVRRPAENEREVLVEGKLDLQQGLEGDSWHQRPSSRTDDGTAHPDMQLNVMNSRAIELIAGPRHRWPLAGDQLYVDLDLSHGNLPPGTRVAIGSAVIEVTSEPHLGCAKFRERFGVDALRFVNSEVGRQLNLRGINAKVITPEIVKTGDLVAKIE